MDIPNTTFSPVDDFLSLETNRNAVCGNQTTVTTSTTEILQIITLVLRYIGPPVLLFGIISNILTLMTLQQPKLKESPYIHLTALAVADLSALVLIYIELHQDPYNKIWIIFRIYIYYPLTNIAATLGVWIMVMMTLERCIFIQFPLWALVRCTNSNARLKIVCIFLASCLVNSPRFVWYQLQGGITSCSAVKNNSTALSAGNTSQNIYIITPFLYGTQFATVVTWLHSIALNFLPMIMLIIFNSFLIYKVRIQHKRRDELGIHQNIETVWTREQTRLTITLIAIVCLFIALTLPSAFAELNIAKSFFEVNEQSPELKILQNVANFLMWLNLSINFLMYTFINVKFMRAFKRMLRHWKRRFHLDKLCCCGQRQRRDNRRQSMFPMVETSEQMPFNNNKNSISQFQEDKRSLPLQRCDSLNYNKDNSFTLSFKLDNISNYGQSM